jgi:D-2-hydroxyacid dehydrogenase (NADP+)
MTAPPIDIVLHQNLPPGVAAAVRSQPGLNVIEPTNDDGVAQALASGAQALVTYTWREDFLGPLLRWIAGCGAGIEQYPLDRFAERSVVLTTAAGVHAECVAEHAFALMLALTRRIGESVRSMTRATWLGLPGEELGGKKLAIVGLGRIGEGIARRAQAFDMQVAGLKRDPTTYSGCVSDVRSADRLAESCDWADIVVLAAPATADRRPIVGAHELEALGAGWIVNVGRGSLIDEPALIAALTHGQLRGAGLDVTTVEPLPAASPLWGLPRVVLTAHNAGDSPNFGPRWGEIFRRNLSAYAGQAAWCNRVVYPGRMS